MNENVDKIQLSILVVGSSDQDVDITRGLETALIIKYSSEWNVQFNR